MFSKVGIASTPGERAQTRTDSCVTAGFEGASETGPSEHHHGVLPDSAIPLNALVRSSTIVFPVGASSPDR